MNQGVPGFFLHTSKTGAPSLTNPAKPRPNPESPKSGEPVTHRPGTAQLGRGRCQGWTMGPSRSDAVGAFDAGRRRADRGLSGRMLGGDSGFGLALGCRA
jgi:hypothetical protein